MKREFENIDLECWIADGKLGHTLPAICLLHSSKECGVEILKALNELAAESPQSRRTLTLKASTRQRPLSAIQLRLVPSRPELRVLSVTRNDAVAVVEMTDAGLKLMRRALEAWHAGAEDFCVSADQAELTKRDLGKMDMDSGELWFWGPSMEP